MKRLLKSAAEDVEACRTFISRQGDDAKFLYFSFNQDDSCLAAGTRQGYRIYRCHPFQQHVYEGKGGIGIIEMLHSSSLVAIVGAGDKPAFSPRRLRLWNTKTESTVCELSFVTAITAVKLNRKHIIVALETAVHIFDITDMSTLYTLEVQGCFSSRIALAHAQESPYMACTSSVTGEVIIFDTASLRIVNKFQAHRSDIRVICLNKRGDRIATASEKGTVIRVYTIPLAEKIITFRRGSYPCTIYSLAFDPTGQRLVASSSTGTLHVFKIPTNSTMTSDGVLRTSLANKSSPRGSRPQRRGVDGMIATKMARYLPPSVNDLMDGVRSFAEISDPLIAVRNRCAMIASDDDTRQCVLVVTEYGIMHRYGLDIKRGGELVLEKAYALLESPMEADLLSDTLEGDREGDL